MQNFSRSKLATHGTRHKPVRNNEEVLSSLASSKAQELLLHTCAGLLKRPTFVRSILAAAWAAESLPVRCVTNVACDSRLSLGTHSSLSGTHLQLFVFIMRWGFANPSTSIYWQLNCWCQILLKNELIYDCMKCLSKRQNTWICWQYIKL